MQLLSLFSAFLLAGANLVNAQATGNATNATDFATGLLTALNTSGLTSLSVLIQNNSAALLPYIQSGNKTVFGPSNSALSVLPSNTSTADLLATLSYHIVNGTLTNSSLPNNTDSRSIVLSNLRGRPYVLLPNNRSQALVLGRNDDGTGEVHLGNEDVAFNLSAAVQYQNLLLVPINDVLQIPGSIASVAGDLDASSLIGLLQQTQLATALNNASAVTVFAPSNDAIEAAQSQISAANTTVQQTVLLNHVLNGTVVYSSQLPVGQTANLTSAAGQNLTLAYEGEDLVVRSGNITARIISSDNVANNGVVHVIDAVLLATESNTAAAESAAASAASATATAVQGVATVSNADPSATATAPGAGETNSAGFARVDGLLACVLAAAAAFLF